MDNTTIYEFLQEKSVTPTGPGNYSNSTEISNALKATRQNSSLKTKGKKDVNFYDYDGSLVDSYSAEEFLQLSAMPANPTHEGLTAQGWNYTLANAKSYVADYGALDIGQMYSATETQSDGKTRLYIHLEDGRLSPTLGIGLNGTCDVDWGDGTAHSTMTGSSLSTLVTSAHTYAAAGDYVIVLTVTGEFAFIGTDIGSMVLTKTGTSDNNAKVYENSITKLEIGSNVTSISDYAFYYCYSLKSVSIPSSVTSIGESAFQNCYSLTSITIPSSVTSISDYAFSNCYSLKSVSIPSSVTSISKSAFSQCSSLNSITIPSSVTSISDYAFYYCYSLKSVSIPSSVTSISSNVFNNCYSLTSVTILDSVTSIGLGAFTSCYGLGFIKFKGSTPATVLNVNAWSNIPTDCIIYVPKGSLSAYTSASNYPSSSTYTYVEY